MIEDLDASDVDTTVRGSGLDRKPGVNLSTLLNCLDGIITPHGLITMATTNHVDHLDPAITRPGRFDLVIEVESLTKDEFVQMCLFFDKDPNEYTLDYFEPMTGAQMRSLLLTGGVSAIVDFQKGLRYD